MLRSAEQSILRDFRWTGVDPITFCDSPASNRGYAKRPIRSTADSSSTPGQKTQRDVVDNPNDFKLSSRDREMQLQEQIKQMEQDSLSSQQQFTKATATIRILETTLAEARQSIKKLEGDTSRDRRDMERIRLDYRFEIATERNKAKREVEDKYREERESFKRKQLEQEAALNERGALLEQKEANFDAMEAEAREKARVDALRDAERAYVGRYDELEVRRDELEKAQANVHEKEAMFDSRVADAEAAARDEVRTQAQKLIVSAAHNEELANAHLDEAVQLQNNAARIERDAVDGRKRQSQMHNDTIKHMNTSLERITNGARAAVTKESNAAIADFRQKLENAEYREQVERASYDDYRKVWEQLEQSSFSLNGTHWAAVSELRLAANAWVEAARFNASKIHRTFPGQYPDLSSKIKQFLDSACERATDDADRAEHSANDVVADMLRGLFSRGHYSRMLTRFHRFNRAQGTAEMARVLTLSFGEPLIANLQREMERKRTDLRIQLKEGNGKGHIEKHQTEIDETDQRLETISAIRNFISFSSKYEVLKNLREDSVAEKKLQSATLELREKVGDARKPWRQFVDLHPNTVFESEVDKDVQAKDRADMKRLLDDMQSDFNNYHESIWERSLLEQQLGEAGEPIANINARIDRDRKKAHSAVQSKLERLARQRSSRPLAFRAAPSPAGITTVSGRGSAGSSRARVASRIQPATHRVSKPLEKRTGSMGQLEGDVAKLKLRLADHSNYSNDEEMQEDRDALESTRLELMRQNLEKLKSIKSALEKDPKSSTEKLSLIKSNISNVEKRLAGRFSAPGSMRGSTGSSTVTRLNKRQRRARRIATSTNPQSTSNSEPTSTDASDSTTSDKPEETAAPSLKFTPTASQQSWHPRWLSASRPFSGNEVGIKTKTALQGSNAAMMSNILGISHQDAVLVPKALQVYSLHSLHTTAFHDQLRSDTEDFPDISSTSVMPTVRSFDDPTGLTQSSTETISDPESDYEPSDSEASVANSVSEGHATRATDPDPSPSPTSTQEFVDALESQSPILRGPTGTAAVQVDPGLTYNISPEDYRRAAMASQSTNAAFWTYRLYKSPEGKTPTIHYCTNLEAAEAQAKQFLNEPVLGFDLEWEMGSRPGKSSIKNCVSLVQIASETKIGLFQLALFKGDTAEQLMPPSLRRILESREIAKTGVNVSGDAGRIEKCFGFQMRGLFELSHLYNVVTWSEWSPERVNKKLLNLADQVHNTLLLPMKKDKVRTSQWSKRLRFEQTEYAASDAYAGFRLYHALEARRKRMNPMPPRPAFWEEKKPLVLGDGTVVVPRMIVKKKVGEDGKFVEDEEEEEEFFDALETLDPYQLDTSQTAGIPLAGLSISYPTLPTLDEGSDQLAQVKESEQVQATVEEATIATASSEAAKEGPKPHPTALTSPAVTQADSWAQTFRSKLPTSHNLRNKQAHLRAYHLWHYQSHDCKAVAALLRDPPLSITTVASYVLQAVSEGKDLDFEKDRFVAAMELLPPSVRGRYWWVVERLERGNMAREVGREYR